MPGTESILVVLDPASREQPALERAAWYAKRTGAALELFICDYEPDLAVSSVLGGPAALEPAQRRLIATHLRTLKAHARRLSSLGIEATIDARWDYPLDQGIVRKVLDAKPDLVLKDTHYHSGLRRALFSNSDWNLIRACPAPLWLVKPRPMADQPRIVAAIDPMHAHGKPDQLDDRILAAAAEVREAVDGNLRVFHAYDATSALAVSADSFMMPLSVPFSELAEALKRRHERAVFALTDPRSIERSDVEVHDGAVGRLLLALCEQSDDDLVVMGAVSRRGLPQLFIGSTAERVLDKLPCDLLIVKPEGACGPAA